MTVTKSLVPVADSIRERLGAGDPNEALAQAEALVIDVTAQVRGDEQRLGQSLALLADCLQQIYGAEIAALARNAAQIQSPADRAQHLAGLGDALHAKRRYALAAGVLLAASVRAPEDLGIRAELAAAFEVQGHYRAALEAVGDPGDSWFMTYLQGFYRAANGDVHGAAAALGQLGSPDLVEHVTMHAQLTDIVDRGQRVLKGARSLGGVASWRFMMTGGLILRPQASPAAVGDSYGDIAAMLSAAWHVATVGSRDGSVPTKVYGLPTAGGQALARAVAARYGIPWSTWRGEPDATLIVGLVHRGVVPELWSLLRSRPAGQVLAIHSIPANVEQLVAPDIASHVTAMYSPPWQDTADRDDPFWMPEEPPSAQAIAESIVQAWPDQDVAVAVSGPAGTCGIEERTLVGTRSRSWAAPR